MVLGGYGFKGRGKLGIRHEREGTIQMPWKKLRAHHEREEHYSDTVEKIQSPSRTGRALFRCRAENSESITNGKGTSSTRAVTRPKMNWRFSA
jgi:hypothetical protein